jgi:hypothetical protein
MRAPDRWTYTDLAITPNSIRWTFTTRRVAVKQQWPE